METVIKMKNFGKWKEVAIPLDLPTLLKYRKICSKEFKDYLEREKNTDDWGRLGFTPNTFTIFWLRKNEIKIAEGSDGFVLVFAIRQKIQYMNEDGDWVLLPSIYIWEEQK